MSVSYSGTTGGASSDGTKLYALQQVSFQLPDSFPGNILLEGVIQPLSTDGIAGGGSPVIFGTAVQLATNSIALPAVPGSGTTYYILQANTTTGVVTLKSSSVAAPAADAGNVVIFTHSVPTGATIPWMVAPTLVENWP